MIEWAFAAALALGQTQPGAEPAGTSGADRRIVAVLGNVRNWGDDPDDWFRLIGLDAKLMLPRGRDREALWEAIDESEAEGRTLQVRIDAGAGRLASTGNHVVYPVCSIRTGNGKRVGNEARNCPPRAPVGSEAERLLALGLVSWYQQPAEARRLLTEALESVPALPRMAQAVALKGRTDATEAMVEALEPDDPEHDRLLVQVLDDYRRLAELIPDNHGVPFALARTFQGLGAYDEAQALYEGIGRRWPETAFEVAVQSAALQRQRGNYREALRILDAHPRTESPTQGMKFHYHRAWTLVLLDREEEALRDLEAGLQTQPDYGSAYMLRACAHARLGRLDRALADARAAHASYSVYSDLTSSARQAELARSRNDIEALEAAVPGDRERAASVACRGWDRWSRPRARSPLLPPAAD